MERIFFMKRLLLGLLIVILVKSGFGQVQFQEPISLEANEQPIKIEGGYIVPNIIDWNNDGNRDLLIGHFYDGLIQLYLNEGSDNAPQFGKFTYLHAGSERISLPDI